MAAVSQLDSEIMALEELHSGDRLTQPEFHRIYERMPEHFKAELIGGIVYVASPLRRPHGKHHLCLGTAFGTYVAGTPGVDAGDNATIILGTEDEPQPDLHMGILPEYGGQWRENLDEYIEGATELLAEIAYSSRAIDLHAKRERYAQAGVREYIVVCRRPLTLRWFDLVKGTEFAADGEGIFRSAVFPGLWLHAEALLQVDYARVLAVLQRGLASPEHQAFVAQLAARGPNQQP